MHVVVENLDRGGVKLAMIAPVADMTTAYVVSVHRGNAETEKHTGRVVVSTVAIVVVMIVMAVSVSMTVAIVMASIPVFVVAMVAIVIVVVAIAVAILITAAVAIGLLAPIVSAGGVTILHARG